MENKKKNNKNSVKGEKQGKKEYTKKNVVSFKDKRSNKLVYIILGVIIFVVLLIFFLTKDDKNSVTTDTGKKIETSTLSDDDALTIGEKKYLEFLWMVDGAFNDSRYNSKLKVNGKVIDSSKVSFVCKYDEQKEWCIGENFESAFKGLFASNITYRDVYGDGLAFNWYEQRADGFYFKNITACDVSRMSSEHTIELLSQESDKLTFKVSFTDNIKEGIYKGEHPKNKDFILVKEGSDWKVSRAYYHDLCFQDYPIPR